MPALTASKPGASAYARTSRSAAVVRARAPDARSSRRAPRAARARCAAARAARAAAPARSAAPSSASGISGCAHRPGGRDRRHRAGVAGERELERHPAAERVARDVRPVDPERQQVRVHGARQRARRDPPVRHERVFAPGGRVVAPRRRRERRRLAEAGMSIAITSRSSASRSSTGSHMWRSVPSAWMSTSGGPLPRRVWAITRRPAPRRSAPPSRPRRPPSSPASRRAGRRGP